MESKSKDLLDEFEEEYSGPLHGLVLDIFREHSSDPKNSIAEDIKNTLKDKYQSRQESDNTKK